MAKATTARRERKASLRAQIGREIERLEVARFSTSFGEIERRAALAALRGLLR